MFKYIFSEYIIDILGYCMKFVCPILFGEKECDALFNFYVVGLRLG